MAHPYSHVIEEIRRGSFCVIEPFRSRVIHGIMLSNSERQWFVPKDERWDEFIASLSREQQRFICFDMRRIMDLPIGEMNIVDVRTLLGGGDHSLLSRVRENFGPSPLVDKLADVERMWQANSRAIKTAQVEIGSNFDKTMPNDFFLEYLRARAMAIGMLYVRFIGTTELDDWWRRLDFIKALHEVELNGICVDKEYVDGQLLKKQEPATAKSLRSMQGLYKNGFVTALFNAAGTKTGRLRPEGGFNAMGIPHGPARNAIISRFPNGKIYSFDYNAIDYRSIVSTIGGNFAELYSTARDFHTRTAQFVFKEVDDVRREALKAISYTSIYGGSEATLSNRTGLAPEMIAKVLSILAEPLRPIAEFRERLWGQWQIDGYIEIPGVGRYEKKDEEDMHPGKLLALYAQGYSAYVFERAFTNVHALLRGHGRGSCIIFPVHDELVLDIHPVDEEAGLPMEVSREMETGVAQGFVINYKKGRSYGEVE